MRVSLLEAKQVPVSTSTTMRVWLICVLTSSIRLHYMAVTALTVRFYSQTICGSYIGPTEEKGVGIVYLPNANGHGSISGRGVNYSDRNIMQCRGNVERQVNYHCGPKGTSNWFDTHGVCICGSVSTTMSIEQC